MEYIDSNFCWCVRDCYYRNTCITVGAKMKTLAIIGSHPRTRELFDFNRTDVEVWLFNEARSGKSNLWAKRADVIFQMHIPAIWKNPKNRNDPGHFDWLQTQNECAVYMQEQYPEVPRAIKYPLAEILDMLGNKENHFLTSSVPQALALAAYLGVYDRVEVYGVAMETNTEYQFQREGVSFWLGFLKGRGVDVYFADPTFNAPLYGYEGEVFIKYERFTERIAELEPDFKKAEDVYRAAHTEFNAALEQFATNGQAHENKLMQAVINMRQASEQLGIYDGAMQENKRYQAKADEMKKTADNFVFSRQEFESGAGNNRNRANELNTELISLGTTLEHIHNNIKAAAKGSPKRKKYLDMYKTAIERYWRINNALGLHKGVASENFNYMAYLDQHIRAAGGVKSEEAILESMVVNA